MVSQSSAAGRIGSSISRNHTGLDGHEGILAFPIRSGAVALRVSGPAAPLPDWAAALTDDADRGGRDAVEKDATGRLVMP